ncbi:hypothetical protein DRN58_02140 [Thermococci archaeon]|nr:MAG: hypothetical protein DRN58_02140 [Thermococci archaeon]
MDEEEKERWKKNIKIAHEIAKDKERKERLIKKAYEIGGKYVTTYWGCAQSTFLAIVDTLRTEGIEILTKEDEEKMFPAFVGLAGGTGNIGVGSCGGLVGSGFCVSLVANRSQGVDQKVQESNINHRWISFDAVYKYPVKRYLEKYNGLSCRAVTWARFGKHWDSWNPSAKEEFGREERERGCILDTAGYPCTIPRAAAWAVEDIIELLVKPITLEQVVEEHDLR